MNKNAPDSGQSVTFTVPIEIRISLGVSSRPADQTTSEPNEFVSEMNDPAAPPFGSVTESARTLANEGDKNAEPADELPSTESAGPATLSIDISKAKAFLNACKRASVTYGLGSKVPHHGATPGVEFKAVDCSGFVRELIWHSTTPHFNFPDGSVVQHSWIQDHGFAASSIEEAKSGDGAVRIAFLRQQDSPKKIGHVVIVHNGRTLESHGGVGPDSRAWTGESWQSKARVYLLGRDGGEEAVAAGSSDEEAVAELLADLETVATRQYREGADWLQQQAEETTEATQLHGSGSDTPISQTAFDLIVGFEVTSQKVYEKKYRHPEWPQGASGVTIGIGYDVGYATKSQLHADWEGEIDAGMITALEAAIGVTGAPAGPLAKMMTNVDVPWAAAISVHRRKVLPRWVRLVEGALPNTGALTPDCLGALTSLAYNRGASFSTNGPRYSEMRNIKAHMTHGTSLRFQPKSAR